MLTVLLNTLMWEHHASAMGARPPPRSYEIAPDRTRDHQRAPDTRAPPLRRRLATAALSARSPRHPRARNRRSRPPIPLPQASLRSPPASRAGPSTGRRPSARRPRRGTSRCHSRRRRPCAAAASQTRSARPSARRGMSSPSPTQAGSARHLRSTPHTTLLFGRRHRLQTYAVSWATGARRHRHHRPHVAAGARPPGTHVPPRTLSDRDTRDGETQR